MLAVSHVQALLVTPSSNTCPDFLNPAQVADLPSIVATLLGAGLRPYQLSLDRSEKPVFIKSPEQDLSFGIGTVFVEDPDKCVPPCSASQDNTLLSCYCLPCGDPTLLLPTWTQASTYF